MADILHNEIEVETINPFQLPFLAIPQRDQIPSIGGIYFVISKNGDLLYIGQTVNLKIRWRRHECGINLESPRETKIAWLAVEDFQERIKLEKALIRKFKPPLNWVSKAVEKKKTLMPGFMKKRQKQNKPTQSELEILSVIWELEAATVREVYERLNVTKPTGYTTVLKLLQLMDEKGLVERDRANRAHVYRAKIKQNETGKQMLGDVLQKVFGGSALKLVQQVLETETTTAEDLKEIRKMIREAEKKI
jgi:predicted transcriptional regulator/predicted GIY-YIG superfamily endonuclease